MYLPGFGQARNITRHKAERQVDQRNEQRMHKEERTAEDKPLNRIKRMQAIKAAFIIRQLDLTPQQFDKFMPLYAAYQNELLEVQRQKKQNMLQASGREQIERQIMLDHKIADIKDHYTHEFLNILPPEKVSLIEKSELQFQQEVVKQLSERKNSVEN